MLLLLAEYLQQFHTGFGVFQYLTLRGAGREVELGAFLSEDERLALRAEMRQRLADLR